MASKIIPHPDMFPAHTTIGDIIDLADNHRPDAVLSESFRRMRLAEQAFNAGHEQVGTAQLILVGALVSREIFTIRGVPNSRSHKLFAKRRTRRSSRRGAPVISLSREGRP